jgi:hypothetical protein
VNEWVSTYFSAHAREYIHIINRDVLEEYTFTYVNYPEYDGYDT